MFECIFSPIDLNAIVVVYFFDYVCISEHVSAVCVVSARCNRRLPCATQRRRRELLIKQPNVFRIISVFFSLVTVKENAPKRNKSPHTHTLIHSPRPKSFAVCVNKGQCGLEEYAPRVRLVELNPRHDSSTAAGPSARGSRVLARARRDAEGRSSPFPPFRGPPEGTLNGWTQP